MIAIPLFNKDSSSDISTTGVWRFVFGKRAEKILNIPYESRKTINPPLIPGFTVWTESNTEDLFVYVSFEQKDATTKIETRESRIPIFALYAVLAIVGLGVGALFLKRVEKVIDNPVLELTLLAVVVFGSYFLIRKIIRENK